MRKAKVLHNGELAGVLTELDRTNYTFEYNENYFNNANSPAISLTLPKSKRSYLSKYLFPFFTNLLSEGVNKKLQCNRLKIDENDDFGLLLATANNDTIGAITLKAITE